MKTETAAAATHTVIITGLPPYGWIAKSDWPSDRAFERPAANESSARAMARSALASGASNVSICGPRGWLVVRATALAA